MAGLTWTRQPGMRILFHPSEKVTFGVLGRTGRSVHGRFRGRIELGAARRLSSLQGTQLDAGSNLGACSNNTAVTYSVLLVHGQAIWPSPPLLPISSPKSPSTPIRGSTSKSAALRARFKIVNPALLSHCTSPPAAQDFCSARNLKCCQGFRLITTNF